MKDAKELIPWEVADISIRPYDGLWSFNPSIFFDGERWLCVLRCCDYAMPGGKTIRGPKAGPGHQTKNAMVIFDPATWKPIQVFKMQERDGLPRAPCANVGFEDMRIFKTDSGGLQGIAASLHLARDKNPTDGTHQPPEQVLLSFDAEYNIVAARPIRGDGWSGAQKNWVPFDHCAEPRFLYSIDKGSMFDSRGRVHGDAAIARPSVTARPISAQAERAPIDELREARERREQEARQEQERRAREEHERRERETYEQREREERERHEQEHERRERERRDKKHRTRLDRRVVIGGTETQRVRGGRVAASTSRTSVTRGGGGGRAGNDSTRMMGGGRTLLPKYEGLRGGSQLQRVSDDAWLGVAHSMKYVSGLKYYWHVFYLVDSCGKMKATSEPCKLASEGIEFAAGLAIDGDRVVVSFGVDDMHCRLGETKLDAVMGLLKPA